jgi:hypothetical protein
MPITKEYIDTVNAVLEPACPLVCKDKTALSDLVHKIESYDKNLGQPPSPEMVCKWAAVHEQRIQAAIDAENASVEAERSKIIARRQEVTAYLSDAAKDKEEMIKDVRARQQRAERPVLQPNTSYTQEQINAMSAEEYKNKVLLGENTPLELNQSRPDGEARRLYEKRMLKTKRSQDTPLRRALRREIREGLL